LKYFDKKFGPTHGQMPRVDQGNSSQNDQETGGEKDPRGIELKRLSTDQKSSKSGFSGADTKV
jgi:hypothetical protein